MAKFALLIGVSEYEPGLQPLPSAVKDVEAMQRILLHTEIGGFDEVIVLRNIQRQEIEVAIFNLFANRKKEDLLLLYFSGHGILTENNEFFIATRSTNTDEGKLIPPTAVAANYIHQQMQQSRSKHQVIILDCCYSGAFTKGLHAKDGGTVNVFNQLGGEGRAILTASNSTQYAFEQKGFDLSVYTHFLVEGIEKGVADQDNDGWISVEELHDFVSHKVKETF
ncbi:MAG: caspase family protein [Aulosira sp. DedQUE10]|nr:caspase family protein [Aulosira sp. DedQUE10]